MANRSATHKEPKQLARILREYGPFPNAPRAHGVTFDGERAWFASDGQLQSFDPDTGTAGATLSVPADAGTAFDGRFFFQLAAGQIQKLDPETGHIVAKFPAPGGSGEASGLTWAEGTLWLGQYKNRKVLQIDASTGEVLRSIVSDRFVTGVTWHGDELWHATMEGDESELRRIDPMSGAVLESLLMPEGTLVSGLESDGKDSFFCGGGGSGKVRRVARAG
ncbi:MAG: glutamine cyclotransferase [Pseudomonadota bacterium]